MKPSEAAGALSEQVIVRGHGANFNRLGVPLVRETGGCVGKCMCVQAAYTETRIGTQKACDLNLNLTSNFNPTCPYLLHRPHPKP